MNDIELKNKGNRYFKSRKYEDAIQCYSEAIAKKPGVSIYYTNRALCNLKCRRYERVCQDCRTALEIDPMLVKAHFFLGQALLETLCYDEAIKHFQRAQDLAKEQKVNYGDDIAALIRAARKRRFALEEEARISKEIELQTYLNRLILEDRDRQLAKMKVHKYSVQEVSSDEDKENEHPTGSATSRSPDDIDETADVHSIPTPEDVKVSSTSGHSTDTKRGTEACLSPEMLIRRAEEYQSELNNMFARMDDRRRKREVPDYLCGKISFDVLREPVVTPSGITYDRKDIEEHLQRVGHFDPITRTPLTVDMLVPNLAMKEVVDAFLEENEWALDF